METGLGGGYRTSVESVYTTATLPGLGTQPFYWHSQGTVGFESRPARGYARRGAFYGVTFHDFTEQDKLYGFTPGRLRSDPAHSHPA